MKTSGIISLSLLIIVVVSLLSVWFYPSVQDFLAGKTMWNGVNDFNSEFDASELDSLEDLPVVPENRFLVIIPYLEYDTESLQSVSSFVQSGGTLLLLDDFGYGNEVLSYLGLEVRFSNELLLDPLFCYKNEKLPKITDFSEELSDAGITSVLLNHATTLENAGENSLAWSSPASFLDMDENGMKDENEESGPFVIAAEFTSGKGRVITVTDPSLIISAMMDKEDNLLFLEYLINRGTGAEEVLFDRTHLSKTPLDTSKIRLAGLRDFISHPYTLAGVTALLFVVISWYMLRKGEAIG